MSADTRAGPVAILPMYDWPQVRAATDALWAAVRDSLRAAGISAPDALSRPHEPEPLWRAPGLVVGQTCGLPYVTRLRGAVRLVGSPDFGLDGCPPGHYRSAIIVRRDDGRDRLDGFAGAIPAINALDSQSGRGALAHTLASHGELSFLGRPVITGAHAASIEAVAGGRADLAAIDAVTWRLAQAHLDAAGQVRVLAWTDPTPGLPYITAVEADADRIAGAVADGIAAMDDDSRAALGIRGFVRLRDADYDVIANRQTQGSRCPDRAP